jgi:hypothetical protein
MAFKKIIMIKNKRGRPKLSDPPHERADKRIVYKMQKIEVNGTIIQFDGKGHPKTKILKIYRYHGDINLSAEAIQNFCIDNGYVEAKVNFIPH